MSCVSCMSKSVSSWEISVTKMRKRDKNRSTASAPSSTTTKQTQKDSLLWSTPYVMCLVIDFDCPDTFISMPTRFRKKDSHFFKKPTQKRKLFFRWYSNRYHHYNTKNGSEHIYLLFISDMWCWSILTVRISSLQPAFFQSDSEITPIPL